MADFAVDFIAHLENGAAFGDDLLPSGLALNVNYPLVAEEEEILGIQVSVQGRGRIEPLTYEESKPGVFTPGPGEASFFPEVWRTDTRAFGRGFITVVPFTANFSVDADITLTLELALQELMPPNQMGPMMHNDCNGDGVMNGLDMLMGTCAD